MEIVEFVPLGNFKAKCSQNDNEIEDIVLSDKDWAGYDEDSDSVLGVYDFKSKIEKAAGKGK